MVRPARLTRDVGLEDRRPVGWCTPQARDSAHADCQDYAGSDDPVKPAQPARPHPDEPRPPTYDADMLRLMLEASRECPCASPAARTRGLSPSKGGLRGSAFAAALAATTPSLRGKRRQSSKPSSSEKAGTVVALAR